MDEQRRGHIRDDLKGFFRGDLLFDDLSRSLYSTDASLFQVQPAGVACPRDEEDLRQLVQYAYAENIPLIARGGGTGMAGESLGRGLILDLSRHFRDIVDVGADTVRVQPGVVLRTLQDRLAREGRRFAPQPASAWACTIGGMLATNASGAEALLHGYTRDHVARLRVVLDNGDAADIEPMTLPAPGAAGSAHLGDIVDALVVLLEQNQNLIRDCQPRTRFNRCGYLLTEVLSPGEVDLTKLLVGSEGTLALFTEATLRTIPLSGGRAGSLLCYGSFDHALRAAQAVAPFRPALCDIMDRRLFSLARGKEEHGVADLIPTAAEAVILLEFEAGTQKGAEVDLGNCLSGLASDGLAPAATWSGNAAPGPAGPLSLREALLPSLFAVKGGVQPAPFIEDAAVPLGSLREFVFRVQEMLKEHESTATFLIHGATGQVHARPLLDLNQPEHVSRLAVLAEKAHALTLELGGTISSQHGVGLARTSWVARQYGPLYPVLRQVKAIFDPRGILNPGKIVDPSPRLAAWPLRKVASGDAQAAWSLRWRDGEVRTEANHCNGCGSCRTEAAAERMCPIFRAGRTEAATPRAKANLVRHLLADGDAARLASGPARDIAELCVNCKMCVSECPARINVPKLMIETKAAHVAQQGLERGDWFLTRLETVLGWGSMMPLFANLVLRNGAMRWMLEKVFGLSRRRRLPRLARRSFWSVAHRHGWRQRSLARRPTVVFFPDIYIAFIDPDLGEAAGLVLEHNGFAVYVPPGLRSSGIEALAAGDVETARELAQSNLRVLADLAREGLPIVCPEPSSAIMLKQDYLDLIDDVDARLVARQTVELTAFLKGLFREGRLGRDLQPLELTLGHHVPCHLKALGAGIGGPDLLRLVPGLNVHTIDLSCSGMAGTFGLKAKNLEISLAAGRPMLESLSATSIELGSSECSSCRLQMENGAGKRAFHPVQYLALAYGLMPRLAARLKEPLKGKRVR